MVTSPSDDTYSEYLDMVDIEDVKDGKIWFAAAMTFLWDCHGDGFDIAIQNQCVRVFNFEKYDYPVRHHMLITMTLLGVLDKEKSKPFFDRVASISAENTNVDQIPVLGKELYDAFDKYFFTPYHERFMNKMMEKLSSKYRNGLN